MTVRRGELWRADLGTPRGSSPAFQRPVVVISDDPYNASELRTVTIVALTTNPRHALMPGNVAVSAEVSGLPRDSVVNVTQIATLDRRALEARVGRLADWVMAQVDEGLRRALRLPAR